MENVKEIWKDIPGYKGIYQVSNFGRVKSLKRKLWNGSGYFYCKERILKSSETKKGYVYYYLRNKRKKRKSEFSHRLVMYAFVGKNTSKKIVVNHIDGNKRNNCIDNLEYITYKQNNRHAWDIGLYNDETRKKLSEISKNKKVSKETKKKMSESGKIAWIKRKERMLNERNSCIA